MIADSHAGALITVRVTPRASRAGIARTRDGALVVRLNAAPVDNAANAELIEVIADALGVAKRSVTIASGEKSRRKIVLVRGVTAATVRQRLGVS